MAAIVLVRVPGPTRLLVAALRSPTLPVILLAALLAGLVGTAGALAAPGPGAVSPAQYVTGNGRHLTPAGRMTTVGDFPTGGALTPDGRFYWVVDSGHGHNDVTIVNVATGMVAQVLPLPGTYVGVGFSPDGRSAYVSGEPLGNSHPAAAGPTKADGGDAIHVFSVDPESGHASELQPISLPATKGGTAQSHSVVPLGLVPLIPGPGPSSGLGWPEGLAVTPDGKTLLVTLNQADQLAIIDVHSRAVTLMHVGAYPYGVAVSPSGATAYVTNEGDGTLSILNLASRSVTATVPVGGSLGSAYSHPEGVAVDPHRPRVYVAVANRDLVAFVNTTTNTVERDVSLARPQGLGTEPVSVAVSPDGHTLYAADAGEDALGAIALGDRPAAGPDTAQALPRSVVRVRPVSSIARYISTYRAARRVHHAGRRLAGRLGARYLRATTVSACSGPTRLQASHYVSRVLKVLRRRRITRRQRRRALARARRSVAPIRRCGAGFVAGLHDGDLIGRVPTAAYPSDVAVAGSRAQLVWVAAKGLGAGPNPEYGVHFAASEKAPYGSYVVDKLLGRVGVLPQPNDQEVRALTPVADAQVRPTDLVSPVSPITGPNGGPSAQIKHVFYVVKENRTYDQIFGANPRGNGSPALELFDDNGVKTPAGGVTPNAHALTRRFPLLDNFYANSEVSVDGHIITAGAYAIDYVQKALHASYGGRGRVDEFGTYPVTFAPRGFIFDQLARQGISFQNFGELSAGNEPAANDGRPTYANVVGHTFYNYPPFFGCSFTSSTCSTDSGTIGPAGQSGVQTSRFDFFQSIFNSQVAAGNVPSFSYLTLPNDHTDGVDVNYPSPRALVADNDLGLGQIVDLISHSSIWSSSAIFVMEDDSQDGADHVDAHRMPGYVISPWVRTGGVISTRYDQLSMMRTAELMVGAHPLSLSDALATPMNDAFATTPNSAPYQAITPQQSLDQRNSAATARGIDALLPYHRVDLVPQELFDQALWHSVYGARSIAPRPGPDASPIEHARATGALSAFRQHHSVSGWLKSHTPSDTQQGKRPGD